MKIEVNDDEIRNIFLDQLKGMIINFNVRDVQQFISKDDGLQEMIRTKIKEAIDQIDLKNIKNDVYQETIRQLVKERINDYD